MAMFLVCFHIVKGVWSQGWMFMTLTCLPTVTMWKVSCFFPFSDDVYYSPVIMCVLITFWIWHNGTVTEHCSWVQSWYGLMEHTCRSVEVWCHQRHCICYWHWIFFITHFFCNIWVLKRAVSRYSRNDCILK